MPSPLRESSLPSISAPDQKRTAQPLVSTSAPVVDNTTSPANGATSPALREKRESDPANPHRTSQKTVGSALWASVPALLLLGLGAAMRDNQLPRPLAGGDFEATGKRGGDSLVVSDQSAVIPQSQTLVVTAAANPAPIMWRARLIAGRGVTGHAPIDGQITRVYVREGQNVEVGDRVLRIASSRQVLTERVEDVPAPSHLNRRAERAQVRAAQAKNALQAKMERAQEQLIAAQERVAQAKARIARTSEIVRKLQAGIPDESSTQSSDQTVDEATIADNADSRPSKDSAAQQAATQKHSNALREAQDAERRANRAESRAAAAQKRAEAQEEAARGLAQKARDLRAQRARELRQQKSDEENQPAAEEPLARSEASASDADGTAKEETPKSVTKAPRPVRKVSVSQGEVESAQAQAQSAASRASSASDKAQNLATEAARARASANTSSSRASRLMSQLQLWSDDSAPPKRAVRRRNKPRLRPVKKANDLPSISQAARMVQAATEESAAAQSEARRLKAQVDSYSQQAQETRQNLDASSSALQSVQQTVQQRTLDRTLVANLSVVRAPSSGTVLWVAPVAEDVSSGEPIIRMGARGALRARFADRSGLWRSLKPDMMLPARVSDPEEPSETPLSMPEHNDSSTRLPQTVHEKADAKVSSSQPAHSGAANSGISAMARVESVTPPERAGEPAIVRVAVSSTPSQTSATSGQRRRRRLRSGMTVSCLFPRPVQPGISLPRTAILSGEAAPALLASALSSPAMQQSTSDPISQDDSVSATGSNNSAASRVVSGAKSAASSRVETSIGEKNATSTASANPANAAQNAATNAGWVAVLTPLNAGQDVHRIEWRRVVLGAEHNAAKRIVDGLRPGERVALQPSLLWTYLQSYGADATIRLGQHL